MRVFETCDKHDRCNKITENFLVTHEPAPKGRARREIKKQRQLGPQWYLTALAMSSALLIASIFVRGC
jgi:hypothetical protein